MLAALPDVKDVDACVEVLEPFPVTFVGAGRDYLDYTHLAAHGQVLTVEDACEQALASGKNILAVGTMSFAGAVLEFLDAPPISGGRCPGRDGLFLTLRDALLHACDTRRRGVTTPPACPLF